MTDRRQFFVLMGALAATPACALADQAVAFPYGQTFVAESLAGTEFADTSRPTLHVTADGKVNGSAGCNRYHATAKVAGATLAFGPLAMTRKACFGAGGDNERRFAPAIAATSGWRMERRTLVLETTFGPLRFRRS